MTPTSLLLTRPKGRNQSLQMRLSELGLRTCVAPMISIQTTPLAQQWSATELHQWADIIIFISTNAVEFAEDLPQQIANSQLQCIAVGQATQAALKQRGVVALCAPAELQQTEGLLQLPQLQAVENKRIAIVRGVGGREDLAESLSALGAEVRYWQVYQRGLPDYDIEQTIADWRACAIDTIVITSGEGLTNLNQLAGERHWPWLANKTFIVPSERVLTLAKELGITNLHNAQGANDQAVIDALSQLKGNMDERQQTQGHQRQ
ncbi:uroporphyrinogen-III synthase [Paraferrimonas sedimenticola]|uniref:Uroporphyrinogen-III synthase n=1 Tax=Paraferrimonas sedimenticola TaxID=375674 RepID=A0AA37W1W1_9GAMM|nr:uroporphyrinogen-III synthase [Paraferrimonas sedimenticola]GLP97480.1 uroporphyrinogen III methyltransferase [Paraferrimonas sedimenticola]